MAWSVDQATLGTVEGVGGAESSVGLTTTHAVASGGLIVIVCGLFANGALTVSFSGGSLTWNTSIQLGAGGNVDGIALGWALAPAGLASSSVITTTFTGQSCSTPIVAAMSFLGAKASSPQDGTSSHQGTTAAWTGGGIVTSGGSDLVVGACWGDGNLGVATDTPSGAWQAGPLLSDNGTNGGVSLLEYRMNVAAGTYTPGGTFAGASNVTGTWAVGTGFLGATVAATDVQHLKRHSPAKRLVIPGRGQY